jgi:hypothetical protein
MPFLLIQSGHQFIRRGGACFGYAQDGELGCKSSRQIRTINEMMLIVAPSRWFRPCWPFSVWASEGDNGVMCVAKNIHYIALIRGGHASFVEVVEATWTNSQNFALNLPRGCVTQ